MPAVDQRWQRLAALAVHGANVQPGQLVLVSAEHGQPEPARAVAAAAYDAGARFVDVIYYDMRVKRQRVLHADPDTLDFVPRWWGERLLAVAEEGGARISFAGLSRRASSPTSIPRSSAATACRGSKRSHR